ncbi:hypothetical protein GCM10029976_006510 [Kribbella albertanoniae]
MADQNHAAGMRLQLCGQVRETARIQMVGGLVEQQQFVSGTKQTSQPDPIPLPDRQRRQHPTPIINRTQRRKRDINPPIGVPRVQCLSHRERVGVLILRARPLLSQRRSRTIEPRQRSPHIAQLDIDQIADSPVITDRHLLISNPDPTSTPYFTRIGNETPGQNLKQRGLPTPVLPNHPEPIPSRHGQIHTLQNGMPAPHNPNPTSRQMRPGTRRYNSSNARHTSSEANPDRALPRFDDMGEQRTQEPRPSPIRRRGVRAVRGSRNSASPNPTKPLHPKSPQFPTHPLPPGPPPLARLSPPCPSAIDQPGLPLELGGCPLKFSMGNPPDGGISTEMGGAVSEADRADRARSPQTGCGGYPAGFGVLPGASELARLNPPCPSGIDQPGLPLELGGCPLKFSMGNPPHGGLTTEMEGSPQRDGPGAEVRDGRALRYPVDWRCSVTKIHRLTHGTARERKIAGPQPP